MATLRTRRTAEKKALGYAVPPSLAPATRGASPQRVHASTRSPAKHRDWLDLILYENGKRPSDAPVAHVRTLNIGRCHKHDTPVAARSKRTLHERAPLSPWRCEAGRKRGRVPGHGRLLD